MITVSNESWTQEFWLKEFNAEHQANIIKLLEKKWEFSFDNIFPIYMSKVDVQQLDHISLLPVNVVMEFFRDKLSPILNDDCNFELYSYSHDCAYKLYLRESDKEYGYSLERDRIPLSLVKHNHYDKNGKTFLRIGGVDYDWTNVTGNDVAELALKKALHG